VNTTLLLVTAALGVAAFICVIVILFGQRWSRSQQGDPQAEQDATPSRQDHLPGT
jgi:hypothetical protein